MKNIGTTGTRDRLTQEQTRVVSSTLLRLYEDEIKLHHGACVGSDYFVANKAKWMGYLVVAHPPINNKLLSTPSILLSDEVRPAEEYLDRNHNIVDETDLLLALSNSEYEMLRSGTWATIRYARILGRKIHIVNPSGRIEYENCD